MNDSVFLIPILCIVAVLAIVLLKKAASYEKSWVPKVHAKMKELDVAITDTNIIILKNTLIEMDKLLDFVFQKRGYPGETMGERLKNAKKTYDRTVYNDIWTAHKLRNALVHDVEITTSPKEITTAYQILRAAVKKLI